MEVREEGFRENGEETRDETENVEGGRGQLCCGGCAVGCKEGRGKVLEARRDAFYTIFFAQ